ncbi:MAG TPA: histidine phosphatase family protein [Longimicrobiales bacterium]|nr:histidine phosphatase family protein [Longimicrobiales bacterium]
MRATAPTLLLLVRHGDTGRFRRDDPTMNGWIDVPLSGRGRAQAERVARRLRGFDVTAPIYTSTLGRARETAAIISRRTGLPIVPLRSLREIRCGIVDGWPVSRVQRLFPDWWRANLARGDADFRWPGGESYRHFRSRVLRAVLALVCRHPGERVIVVTHAGVVTQLLGALCGITPARWDSYRPAAGSLTMIEWCGAHGVLHSFDDREHLERSVRR